MKITSVSIKNFRSYKDTIKVKLDDLNVFVGKNDIGKSTLLEALDIFFNDGSGVIKLDKDDINKEALNEGDNEIIIGATFSELPQSLVIDASHETNLSEEYLLNMEGELEVIKKYPNAGKPKWFLKANHPTSEICSDLLNKTNAQLKGIIKSESIECDNQSINSVIRKAIYSSFQEELSLEEQELDLSKGDGKSIPTSLEKYFPMYTLFQSDRKNSDGDSEVQDPMQLAVKEIFSDPEIQSTLASVAQTVEQKLNEVSAKTLEKLSEMNPEIASSLTPVIPPLESLKWKDVFKSVSISGDNDIPINKRGSGVKRLVLLNFFRAEAERRRQEKSLPSIIYAIEEPETSQHTNHQIKLIKAFKSLSQSANTQLLLTTHSPAVVKQLEFENLKLIKLEEGVKKVEQIEENQLPYPSLNEVNFSAFGEITEEYHNELYEHLKSIHGESMHYKKFDIDYFQNTKGEVANSPWKGNHNEVSIHTYLRNQIHHRADNGEANVSDLDYSIRRMREFIEN